MLMSLEIYALATLAGLGLYFTQNRAAGRRHDAVKAKDPNLEFRLVPASEIPSANTTYDSEHFHASHMAEQRAATKSFRAASKPRESRVIARTYRDSHGAGNGVRKIRSHLSGVELEEDKFAHNNMTPFFGSRVKQNLRASAHQTLMENFTGNNNDVYRTKREIAPMFKATDRVDNVFGSAVAVDRHLDRFAPSRLRTNERPFDQIYVAPGIAQDGFSSKGVGGFHQLYDNKQVLRPKTVDELRVGNHKKETFEGRVLPGAAIGQRGFAGKVNQNRQKVIEERSPLRYFVSAAGNEAATRRPDTIEARPTERMTSSVPYMGDAVGSVKAPGARQTFKESEKEQLDDFGVRNARAQDYGVGDEDDYGREGMHAPPQERDLTSEKTYQGNLTSLVKAIVAPLEDILRINRKEFLIENPRAYGQLHAQQPPMITVKDPNDVARTTIKETLIHDTHEGYITGPLKLTVYDPEDIARVTIRDTTDHVHHPNLHGGTIRSTTRDPDNVVMRTTVKETTLDGDYVGGVQASTQGAAGAYLNSEVEAKQTAREFLADHDYFGTALSGEGKRPVSYDEYFNAELNVLREGTLMKRAPVYEGNKESISADDVRVTTRKIAVDDESPRDFNNPNKLPVVAPLDADDAIHFTKQKSLAYGDDRLDPIVLAGLKSNPYAMKSIACVAGEGWRTTLA